ncbi:MAG: peptidylprolyl isomerase [Candidatus Bathyarchaeia archaeon]
MPSKYKLKTRKKHGFFTTKVKVLIALVLIGIIVVVAYPMVNRQKVRVILITSMGNITIELYDDMPVTSGNFKNLVLNGVYDGTIFHRVVHNFVIQGGDASAKGINVPTIPDELPNKHSNVRGSVAMAKTSAPNSATSQFYINLKDNLHLDSNYSVFGFVVEGMDVVDAIGSVETDANDKPLEDVTLIAADIVT